MVPRVPTMPVVSMVSKVPMVPMSVRGHYVDHGVHDVRGTHGVSEYPRYL